MMAAFNGPASYTRKMTILVKRKLKAGGYAACSMYLLPKMDIQGNVTGFIFVWRRAHLPAINNAQLLFYMYFHSKLDEKLCACFPAAREGLPVNDLPGVPEVNAAAQTAGAEIYQGK